METRRLGRSGLFVPVISFGTGTFGGTTEVFKHWGNTDAAGARNMLAMCIEAGANLIDTADAYSNGDSETILGQAIAGRRNELLIATKAAARTRPGDNGLGTSRLHLIEACEASLRRLRIDHIDLWQMHAFDAYTPIEETVRALDDLVRAGKVRYVGCSNFSGWQLMKSLAVADRYGWTRYVGHQAHYSLIGREFEWELMPLALAEGVGTLVWSPLAGGRLSGKVTRETPKPEGSRATTQGGTNSTMQEAQFLALIDLLRQIAGEVGRSVPEVVLSWTIHRPTIASVIIGARDPAQLATNLAAADLRLTLEQTKRLDEASALPPVYPYWHQRSMYGHRNPPPV